MSARGGWHEVQAEVEDLAARLGEPELLEAARALADVAAAAEEDRAWQARLVALLAHDAHSPLTAVIGFAHTLLRPGLDDDQRAAALGAIARNAVRMSLMLRNAVDATRLRAGEVTVHVGPVELAEVAEPALRRVRDVEADVSVEVVGPGGQVLADHDWLVVALVNVLHNACSFSPPGAAVVLALDAGGIRVEDGGRGFDDEGLAHATDPFWRGPNVPGAGAGLGLYVAARLLELMGGSLSLERIAPAGGSRVRLLLPPAA